jgi:hypothetical protein
MYASKGLSVKKQTDALYTYKQTDALYTYKHTRAGRKLV